MTIEPFQPEHLQQIELQAEQWLAAASIGNPEYAQTLADHGGWTARINGKVVACAGFITLWPGRVQSWAIISATIGAHGMLKVTRAVRRALDAQTGRVECIVASGFDAGHKWAKVLGFKLETPEPMRGWMPGGMDAFLYSRVT